MSEDRSDQFRRFERDFQTTRDDVISLKQVHSALQSDVSDIKQSVRELAARFDESKKTNWPFVGALIAAVPFVYVMMNSLTSNAIAPLTSDYSTLRTELTGLTGQVHDLTQSTITEDRQISNISQQATENAVVVKTLQDQQATLAEHSASSLQADANSRTDRGQLNERMAKLETGLSQEVGDRRANDATLRTQLTEVETQFHAVSDIANLRGAQQERINALLWTKAYGQEYPSGTFFPPSVFQGVDNAGR